MYLVIVTVSHMFCNVCCMMYLYYHVCITRGSTHTRPIFFFFSCCFHIKPFFQPNDISLSLIHI